MYPITVAGIPAMAEVTSYYPGSPGSMGCHCPRTANLIDPGEPPESEEVEFTLYDRKGYRAKWLDPKMDGRDVHDDVEQQVLAAMKQQDRDDY